MANKLPLDNEAAAKYFTIEGAKALYEELQLFNEAICTYWYYSLENSTNYKKLPQKLLEYWEAICFIGVNNDDKVNMLTDEVKHKAFVKSIELATAAELSAAQKEELEALVEILNAE